MKKTGAEAPKSRALSISPTEHRMELYNLNESIRLDGDPNKSIMEHFNPLAEVNPDEDMAILDQLLELQQRDSEFQKAQEADDDELKQVEGEIVQQQSLLLQLRESLKVYHDMKDKYEVLMAEVRHLEVEKTELVEQLDKAHTDPTKGCSKAIKRELEKVEQALARARNESRKHRELYRKAEQEAKKSAVLQRKITELKTGRAKLIKKQQETAARHRDYTEARTREILALKRKDRSNEQRLSKMQKEIQMHKKNLDKRQDYCTKLKDKLDQTESHLMKLLAMRNQELRDRTSVVAMSRRPSSALARKSSFPVPANKVTFAPRSDAIDSINFILDQAVVEKIMILEADQRYEECVTEYSEAMRNMVEAVKALEHARELAKNVDNEIDLDESELIQVVEESELKVELLSEELESLRRQLSETDGNEGKEALAEKLIKDKDAPLLRTVLLDTLEKLIETKILHNRLDKVLQRKASALHGLENEVELLNDKIESLTRTNKLRQVVDSSDVGSVETIHRLASENRSQKMQLQHTQSDLTKLNEMLSEARNDNRLLATKTREAEEKVALVLTASNVSEAIEPSKATLDNIHRIWRQLGRPLEELDEIRFEIENCLDHTCTRLLREAQDLKETTLVELESLEHEIRRMHISLGRMEEDSIRGDGPLVVQLDRLRRTHAEIEVVYRETATRREALKQQAMSLVTLLGLAGDTIPVELRSLLAPETEVLDLRDDLIAQYELQVSELRVRKSQMLVTNAEVLKNAYQLVSDMNLAEHQVFPLVLADIKRRCVDLPEWWDEAIAEIIVRAVSNAGGVVRATQSFREHLLVVYASLESLSRSRRILSDKLKELVEKAQRILLETVDGEVDAIEAYASFHDALFRLPPLSKERMNACIAEIDALLTCVDDMTQSEIEALVVVHEALNVASNDRSMFWSEVEVATSAVDAKNVRPFNEVVQDVSVDAEDWVLQMVADGTKNYRQLESRLVKLQMIHSEVERLRSRQDTKSKIITLDSEVRTLSTKISEFEDTKCNKQRLLTKKSGSVNLLKEERFRKQMQQKFASKLEKLALLLQSWREGNKEDFDSNLLSDEVRMLLDNGGDNMVEWVEKRTEFMHLRTTQSTKKRRTDTSQDIDSLSTSKVAMHRLAEPANATVTLDAARKKSVAPSQPAERRPAFPKPASSLSTSRKRKGDELPPSKPARQTRSSRSQSTSRMPRSPAHDSRKSGGELDAAKENNVKPAAANKKRLTLPPFGHVLESASTPRNADKEN
ncbi:hypothetical protein MPSEU_000906400 [Mayamaea pseudoterrestris]|nr:hypothetical protein MPSEU_000906400 [Mayamaea pseudoterrestris]